MHDASKLVHIRRSSRSASILDDNVNNDSEYTIIIHFAWQHHVKARVSKSCALLLFEKTPADHEQSSLPRGIGHASFDDGLKIACDHNG